MRVYALKSTTMVDVSKVLGMFTIGIKGIEGMKSSIIQQYSPSEKSNATRNSYKIICAGVIKACYHEYARGKPLNPLLLIPDKLLDTLLQCGMVLRTDTRKEAGHMSLVLGSTQHLERQDINFYLEMLGNDNARAITNAVDAFMDLLRGPMKMFIDEPLYKMLLSTTILWKRPMIRFDAQRVNCSCGDLKDCWAQCCEPNVKKAILNFPWNTPTEMAPKTGALIYAIRHGTINSKGEYFENMSKDGVWQNPMSASWTGSKGKVLPQSPMSRMNQLANAHNGRNLPNSNEAGARGPRERFVNPLDNSIH